MYFSLVHRSPVSLEEEGVAEKEPEKRKHKDQSFNNGPAGLQKTIFTQDQVRYV